VVWVPEVIGLEFRYFDGNAWTGNWNSMERKSLPAAVEVLVRMQDSDSPAPPQAVTAEAEAALEEPGPEETARPSGPVHRMVVDLPMSPSYRKPKRTLAPTAAAVRPPRPPRPPVRRIAPPRWPKKTERGRLPEEWIRTRSQ
jgi:hypothetical protein